MIVAGSTSGVSTRSSVLIVVISPIPVVVMVVIFGTLVIGMGVIPTPTPTPGTATTVPNSPIVGEKHCLVPSSLSTQIRSPGVYPIPDFFISRDVIMT